jgi:5-methylcytosine-specific restriction endonuclease McrA
MNLPDGPVKEFVDQYRACSLAIDLEMRQRFSSLIRERNLTRDELATALRQVYWDYPRLVDNPDWVWLTFGSFNGGPFNRDEFDAIIQNYRYPFPCADCNTTVPILVHDRADADRFWTGISVLCPACSERFEQRKDDFYRRIADEKAKATREAEITELRAMPYQEYLMTEHWQTVRAATLKRDHNRCQLCRSTERLQVHHNTYERRGCEDPDDTVTLCGDCHQTFHDHRQLARPQ